MALTLCLAITFSLSAVAQKSPPSKPDWPQPDVSKLAPGPWRDSVEYGRKLIVQTYNVVGPKVADKSLRYSGNNLSCQSCHLNAGMQQFGLPLIGAYGVYPAYMGRENQVRTLEERINGCFERSMNGRALPVGGKEMKALLAYLQFLSTGLPIGLSPEGRGTPTLPLLARAADPRRGADIYKKNCVACHQVDGRG